MPKSVLFEWKIVWFRRIRHIHIYKRTIWFPICVYMHFSPDPKFKHPCLASICHFRSKIQKFIIRLNSGIFHQSKNPKTQPKYDFRDFPIWLEIQNLTKTKITIFRTQFWLLWNFLDLNSDNPSYLWILWFLPKTYIFTLKSRLRKISIFGLKMSFDVCLHAFHSRHANTN